MIPALLSEIERRAEDGHTGCPDNWAGCNAARADVPKLCAALRIAVEALEHIANPDTFGGKNGAHQALAEIERTLHASE